MLLALLPACDEADEPDNNPSGTPLVASSVVGLFREPQPTSPSATAQLGARPAPIAEWNGTSMMVFDIEAGTAQDYGPGTPGYFSPSAAHLLWTRAAFALDGPVTVPQGAAPATEIVDIDTGSRQTTGPVPVGEPFDRQTTPDGYVLRREFISENPFPRSLFHLERQDGEELMQFEAWQAVPAGPGYLAVATEPIETGPPDARGFAPQSTNIFLVLISSGQAVWIASSPAFPVNWPMIADERYVMWTDDYCAPTPGRTRIYDRGMQEITELNATLWLQEFTPDGLIAAGAFGADELIDPETLEYAAVIPSSEAQWSADYRYASVGQVGGHGGLCP
jgi:hypothetical protein